MSSRQSAGSLSGTVLYTRTAVSSNFLSLNRENGSSFASAASSASIALATVRRTPSEATTKGVRSSNAPSYSLPPSSSSAHSSPHGEHCRIASSPSQEMPETSTLWRTVTPRSRACARSDATRRSRWITYDGGRSARIVSTPSVAPGAQSLRPRTPAHLLHLVPRVDRLQRLLPAPADADQVEPRRVGPRAAVERRRRLKPVEHLHVRQPRFASSTAVARPAGPAPTIVDFGGGATSASESGVSSSILQVE